MENLALRKGDHPLRIFSAAERVFVEEALPGRNVEPVESADAAGIQVDIEYGADFSGFEVTDVGERVGIEVDGELRFGEGNVTGDVGGCVTGRLPVAPDLGKTRKSEGKHE